MSARFPASGDVGPSGFERFVPWFAGLASWAHAVAFAPDGTFPPQADAPHYLAVAAGIRAMLLAGHPGTALGMASELAPNPGWIPGWMGGWMIAHGVSERAAVASLLPFHVLLALGAWRGGHATGGREGGLAALALTLGSLGVASASRVAMLDLPLAACAAFAGGMALQERPRAALLGAAAACWAKLAGGPSLLVLGMDTLVRALRVSPAAALRALVACVTCIAAGYAAGLGSLVLGYARESGNVAQGLRGSGGLLARAAGLMAASVGALQPPLLVVLVASLLAGKGGRPILWAVGHPLREDADLALVVRCVGRSAPDVGSLARPPDRSERWPSGCVAQVWEGPLRGGAASPRTAR